MGYGIPPAAAGKTFSLIGHDQQLGSLQKNGKDEDQGGDLDLVEYEFTSFLQEQISAQSV